MKWQELCCDCSPGPLSSNKFFLALSIAFAETGKGPNFSSGLTEETEHTQKLGI